MEREMKYVYHCQLDIDCSSQNPINDIIKQLRKKTKEGATHVEFLGCSNGDVEVNVYQYREENDQEYARRMKTNEYYRKQREKDEHETYLKLKAKYEPEVP